MSGVEIDLSGRAAIVTGAAQGLGQAIARALHRAGASVMLNDISPNVTEVAAEIDAGAGRSFGHVFDVRDESAWNAAVARLAEKAGPIGILVNNAALTKSASVWDISVEEWDDVLAVNLRGQFLGCRAAGKVMRERGSGRIINLSSLAGQRGGVVAGAHYSASKAGILAMTKCFALELAGSGVTVNAIAPAAIEGPMSRTMPQEKVQALAATIPVKRLGQEDEVGMAALYLASDAAGYVTGMTLDINGGVFMR